VLNAGYGQPGFLGEDLPAEAIQQQFETNLVGQYRVLRTLWPILEASPHTRVVFISSVLGFVTLPGRVAYCASKAALESLADGLRLEMPEWRVVLIEPGPVEARFGENSLAALHHWVDVKNSRHLDKYLAAEKRIRNPSGDRVPSERVASLIKTALEESRPRSRYRICRTTHLAIWLKRLLPSQILDIAFRKAL
jgi:NAD(P)-dependent dehydrogenase (short-subunit alcohol dehydrogenase family)